LTSGEIQLEDEMKVVSSVVLMCWRTSFLFHWGSV